MKKLLLIALLATGIVANAQKDSSKSFTGNFKTKDLTVIWEKLYTSKLSFKEVTSNLKMSGIIDKPDVEESLIYGNMIPFVVDYKSAGVTTLGTKPYITDMKYEAYAIIKKTDSNYVVAVKKIKTIMDIDVNVFGANMKGTTYNFEEWAIDKKSNWKFSFVGKPAYTLDYNFNKMFEPLFK